MRADLLLVAFAICIISITVFSSPDFQALAQEDNTEKSDKKSEKGKEMSEKSQQKKLEEKRKEIKQKAIEKAEKIRKKQSELKEKIKKLHSSSEQIPTQKAEKVKERLFEKIDKLNQKTMSILEKVRNDQYLGVKHGINPAVNFTLRFTDVQADAIGNSTDTTSIDGNLNMTTFDVGKKSLKFEVTSCNITVDDIFYHCGFGKGRTISSGNSGAGDSLVIIAFLEDGVLNQIHSTLKIFLESDRSILETDDNPVSILGPQSIISHQWFLNGTANLSNVEGEFNELDIDEIGKEQSQKESAGRNLTINLEESVGISASP